MPRLMLALMVVLCLACAADPEPAADAPAPAEPAPAEVAPAPAETGPGADDKVDVVGRVGVGRVLTEDWQRINEFTRMFYAGELQALHEEFSDAAKQELPLDALLAMRAGLLADHGEELEVVDTAREENQGYRAYKRAARFSKDDRLIEVAWVIGPDESIAGLYVTPDRSREP